MANLSQRSVRPTPRLTTRQLAAIDVLARGGSDSEAAKAAGMPEDIITFCRKFGPVFQDEMHKRRRLIRGASAGPFSDLDALEQRPDGPGRRVVVAARVLLHKIKAGQLPDQFSLRDVYRPGWAGLSQRADAQAVVDLLLDLDALRGLTVRTAGRRATRFVANPDIWTEAPYPN